MSKSLTKSTSYSTLRKQVEQTLLAGQRKIEQAKVQTYWQTGKLISDHILRFDSRSEHYGKEVMEKLARDIDVSTTVLWRCVQFARHFKILASWRESFPAQLSWSHYRELIAVPDDEMRLEFMKRAESAKWTSEQLAQKIRQEITQESGGHLAGGQRAAAEQIPKLIPKKGTLYTYRLIAPDSVHQEEDAPSLWIDLGFQLHRQLPAEAKGFKAGQIIQTQKAKLKTQNYTVEKSSEGEEELFTYKAFVERVVDGDTLLVKVDLGFEMRLRQYLRLRAIDAPELATPEGKKAKAFVQRQLTSLKYILLTSSRPDKYGRYLADIFLPSKSEKIKQSKENKESGIYLNQLLLDQGLAVRM